MKGAELFKGSQGAGERRAWVLEAKELAVRHGLDLSDINPAAAASGGGPVGYGPTKSQGPARGDGTGDLDGDDVELEGVC